MEWRIFNHSTSRPADVREWWTRTGRSNHEDCFLEEDRAGTAVGVEVKAAGTVDARDFAGLELGDRFARGMILYGGRSVVPFGERLAAWPIGALWA